MRKGAFPIKILVVLACFAIVVRLTKTSHGKDKENRRNPGLLGIKGKTVEWIKRCSPDKYNASLSDMDTSINNYGAVQVGDELWLCGGSAARNDVNHQQTKSCKRLSLLDGQWRTLDHQMNQPRIRPVMFVEDTKVIVKSGTTSDIHSKTGCRDTQEVIKEKEVFTSSYFVFQVFDRDNTTIGWVMEDVEARSICQLSSQILTIDCH